MISRVSVYIVVILVSCHTIRIIPNVWEIVQTFNKGKNISKVNNDNVNVWQADPVGHWQCKATFFFSYLNALHWLQCIYRLFQIFCKEWRNYPVSAQEFSTLDVFYKQKWNDSYNLLMLCTMSILQFHSKTSWNYIIFWNYSVLQ